MQKIKEGIIYFLTQEEGGRKSPPSVFLVVHLYIKQNKEKYAKHNQLQ